MDERNPLYMNRIELDELALFRFGHRLLGGWLAEVDSGYLVHCHLKSLFGELAPQPFHLLPGRGRRLVVLGYGPADAPRLREHAERFAEPLACAALVDDGLLAKPMPEKWPAGRKLGFEVRVCPTHRKAKDDSRREKKRFRKGSEVDVFLSRCWEIEPAYRAARGAGRDKKIPLSRENVYRDWLAEKFEAGGAKLLEARLVSFRLRPLLRRSQGAKRRASRRFKPDVLFRGLVEVADGEAFRALLARGVGRHRAFGFGMLLLRPPAPPSLPSAPQSRQAGKQVGIDPAHHPQR